MLIKKSLIVAILVFLFAESKSQIAQVNWYSIEEAVKMNQTKPKKIFIDFYTSWCGWCKRMDATTFTNPVVIEILNKYFYPVKFDAETSDTITLGQDVFINESLTSGRRGAHQFAIRVMGGRLSYPTTAYIDEQLKIITTAPGYKDAKGMEVILAWIAGEHYKTTTFDAFSATYQAKAQ